jgi:hypothetical protein
MAKRRSTARQTRARRANLVKARASRWKGSRGATKRKSFRVAKKHIIRKGDLAGDK